MVYTWKRDENRPNVLVYSNNKIAGLSVIELEVGQGGWTVRMIGLLCNERVSGDPQGSIYMAFLSFMDAYKDIPYSSAHMTVGAAFHASDAVRLLHGDGMAEKSFH